MDSVENLLDEVLKFQLTKEKLKHNKARQKFIQDENYGAYVWLHERSYRLHAFDNIKDKLTDKAYWEILSDIWVDSENIDDFKIEWVILLFYSTRANQKYFMSERDRKVFDNLPKKITIYRGGSEDGLSWTLDKKKASWFANRFNRNLSVFTKSVDKSNCLCYLGERNEDEIIYYEE